MKRLTLTLSLGVLILGYASRSFAQIVLPEIKIVAANYKYLDAVSHEDLAQPVKLLQMKAATYDIKKTDLYEEDYDNYFISFYIPEGSILASYDKDGKLLRTAERYTNIKLPVAVRTAIGTRFPTWAISKNIYLVNYYEPDGTAQKIYKVLLENGDKRIRIKTNEKGEFL